MRRLTEDQHYGVMRVIRPLIRQYNPTKRSDIRVIHPNSPELVIKYTQRTVEATNNLVKRLDTSLRRAGVIPRIEYSSNFTIKVMFYPEDESE